MKLLKSKKKSVNPNKTHYFSFKRTWLLFVRAKISGVFFCCFKMCDQTPFLRSLCRIVLQ